MDQQAVLISLIALEKGGGLSPYWGQLAGWGMFAEGQADKTGSPKRFHVEVLTWLSFLIPELRGSLAKSAVLLQRQWVLNLTQGQWVLNLPQLFKEVRHWLHSSPDSLALGTSGQAAALVYLPTTSSQIQGGVVGKQSNGQMPKVKVLIPVLSEDMDMTLFFVSGTFCSSSILGWMGSAPTFFLPTCGLRRAYMVLKRGKDF